MRTSFAVKLLLMIVASLALLGCAMKTYNPNNQAQVAGKVAKNYDTFMKTTWYVGPNLGDGFDLLGLRAFVTENPTETTYQIYVSDYYDDKWRFYAYAYDSDGNEMDFVKIDRQVTACSSLSCSHKEDFALVVNRKYLQARATTGLRFKAAGKGGEAIFFIPPAYISGFLQAVPDTSLTEQAPNKKKSKK